MDPRQLDPDAYAFQSGFERYRTLRTYYDRVCARFEAMHDPATWSDAEFQHLEELSSLFSFHIRQKAEYADNNWHPNREITYQDECEALDKCTPQNVAHTCIHGFAIKAFQRFGMAFDAYAFIDRGLVAFESTDDVNANCYEEPFLALLTGNAKFDAEPVG